METISSGIHCVERQDQAMGSQQLRPSLPVPLIGVPAQVHHPVAVGKFTVLAGNELDHASLRAMPTPASKEVAGNSWRFNG